MQRLLRKIPPRIVACMTSDHDAARSRFPRGLIQPPHSFRFSLDALILASFTLRHSLQDGSARTLVDLGCGCGIIALACLLERKNTTATGFDMHPELIAAARENAILLGLENRFTAEVLDLSREKARLTLAKADVVVANMPYRSAGSGRVPQSFLRRTALFAGNDTCKDFLKAASAVLLPTGCCSFIYPWAARKTLFDALDQEGFALETVLPVSTINAEPLFCLVNAVHFTTVTKFMPPLTLRSAQSGGGYTPEALAFCPWL